MSDKFGITAILAKHWPDVKMMFPHLVHIYSKHNRILSCVTQSVLSQQELQVNSSFLTHSISSTTYSGAATLFSVKQNVHCKSLADHFILQSKTITLWGLIEFAAVMTVDHEFYCSFWALLDHVRFSQSDACTSISVSSLKHIRNSASSLYDCMLFLTCHSFGL